MNDAIHAARYVQKLDSQLIGSFSSLPAGPLGQIRNGRPVLYHRALPPFPHRPVAMAAALTEQKPWNLRDRVLVWPIVLGCGDFLIPDHLLRTLDGTRLCLCAHSLLRLKCVCKRAGAERHGHGHDPRFVHRTPVTRVDQQVRRTHAHKHHRTRPTALHTLTESWWLRTFLGWRS